MIRLKTLNVFEFLRTRKGLPETDFTFKVLYQLYFKVSKFYVFSGIKLLDANPEFYVLIL